MIFNTNLFILENFNISDKVYTISIRSGFKSERLAEIRGFDKPTITRNVYGVSGNQVLNGSWSHPDRHDVIVPVEADINQRASNIEVGGQT